MIFFGTFRGHRKNLFVSTSNLKKLLVSIEFFIKLNFQQWTLLDTHMLKATTISFNFFKK